MIPTETVPDVYGYCGFISETFEQLLGEQRASVAFNNRSPCAAAGEVLQMVYDMYNVYKVYP